MSEERLQPNDQVCSANKTIGEPSESRSARSLATKTQSSRNPSGRPCGKLVPTSSLIWGPVRTSSLGRGSGIEKREETREKREEGREKREERREKREERREKREKRREKREESREQGAERRER